MLTLGVAFLIEENKKKNKDPPDKKRQDDRVVTSMSEVKTFLRPI
jgi:hypothetical protein